MAPLFSESGAYLGRYETTDTLGKAGFLLPSVTFRFRADYNGEQRWSDIITIFPDETTIVNLNFSDQPAVNLNADSETIVRGGSSVLTWTSVNADSVSIDQGVGAVDLNSTITVTPEATTSYTITATGAGEYIIDTATVTVTKPAPIVNIHADPETIPVGGSSVLTWSSSYADSVSLDNGIGKVDLNGSTTLSPADTTTYTITATGEGGTATASVTVTPVSLNVIIESPSAGETIERPDVMVKGTITNIPDCETGVTVNGVGALVQGSGTTYEFAAKQVPLEEGENEIIVSVIDADGYEATATISVYAEIAENYITLTPYEEWGVSPFKTTLTLSGTFSFTEDPDVFASSSEVEITKNSGEYTYNISISTAGLYYVTAEAVHDGTTYSDTVALLVYDQEVVNDKIQERWNNMRTALSDGDINEALECISPLSIDKYEEIFNILADELEIIADELADIELVYIYENFAKYNIQKEEVIDDQSYIMNYSVYFIRDAYGNWYVDGF